MENLRGIPLDGEWWNSAMPGSHYKGVLELDEEHHGTLTLHGTESELSSVPFGPDPFTFFGRLENHYTYEVTLFDIVLKRGPGRTAHAAFDRQTSAEYHTNIILVGGHIKTQEERFINGALVHLTGLEEWCDLTGFSGQVEGASPRELATETVHISFQASVSRHYDLGDGRLLRFLSQYRGPHMFFNPRKQLDLAERNTIELLFSDMVSIDKIVAEITIWQTFITLGLRRPSYIDDVMLLLHSNGEDFTRMGLIVPGRKPESSSHDQRSPRDVLFNQSKLGSNIGVYLNTWRLRQDEIEIAVLLFSGAAYQDGGYTHSHLLTYLQAIEIFHRESFKIDRFPDIESRKVTIRELRAAVPSKLTETLQNELRDQLGYIGNLTLLDRLKHLYSLYPKSLWRLFRRGEDDLKLLKDTRNFLTHYGDQKTFGREFLWSRTIFVLKEKARLFIEICLLSAMGMSDDDIAELVREFEPYLYWCTETSMDHVKEMLSSKS